MVSSPVAVSERQSATGSRGVLLGLNGGDRRSGPFAVADAQMQWLMPVVVPGAVYAPDIMSRLSDSDAFFAIAPTLLVASAVFDVFRQPG